MTTYLFSHKASARRNFELDAMSDLEQISTYQSTGCSKALESVLLKYSNLCMKIALRYRAKYDLEDTYQNCMVFLIEAVRKFDHARGVSFFSFAYTMVSQDMSKKGIADWSSMKAPGSHAYMKAFRRIHEIASIDGTISMAKANALADKIDVKVDDVVAAFCLFYTSSMSLDLDSSDAGGSLMDTLVCESDLAEEFIQRDYHEKLMARILGAFDILNDKERKVVEMRLMAEDPLTNREIGLLLGVSAQRVNQIEKLAIFKLKEAA